MQKFIHWLEEGRGDTLLRILTATLLIILVSFYLSGKRYKGPGNERVLEKAVLAQQLADGHGFTTPVWHPQAVMLMERRHGWEAGEGAHLPSLYTPPGYPVLLAGAFKILPDKTRDWLEGEPFRRYYLADFFLLGVSLLLFWANTALIAYLACQLFGSRAAWLAAGGYVLSAGVWEGAFAVDGALLLSLLLLLLLLAVWRFEKAESLAMRLLWPALSGVLCALLFLTDYPAGLTLAPTALYLALRAWMKQGDKKSWFAALPVLVLPVIGFAIVAAPWLMRNLELVGNPLGLAGQEIAWKAGDSTAEPSNFRNAFSAGTAQVNFRKLMNKGLDGMAEGLRSGLWQGAGLVFAGFFLASLFYRFRSGRTDALRWFALGLIIVQGVGGPFLDSGEAPIWAGAWLAPLLVIFGAGFFFVLLESAGEHSVWKRRGWVVAVIILQALPVLHWVLQPGVLGNYSFPPYAPPVFRTVKLGMVDRFYPGFGVMSDAPAGLAWYGKMTVWGQPDTMRDFVAVLERQPIGALVLTPLRLDQPFYTDLLKADGGDPRKDAAWSYGWGALYHGLAAGRIPAFFPLQKRIKIWNNIYVCLDPSAYQPGVIR